MNYDRQLVAWALDRAAEAYRANPDAYEGKPSDNIIAIAKQYCEFVTMFQEEEADAEYDQQMTEAVNLEPATGWNNEKVSTVPEAEDAE